MNEAIDPTTLAYYARSRQQEKPRYLGRRYSEDGLFQSERGNTIVCHPVGDRRPRRRCWRRGSASSTCPMRTNLPSPPRKACT